MFIYANNCIVLSLHLPFKGWDIASLNMVWGRHKRASETKMRWPGVSRDNFHGRPPLSALTDPAHCFRTGRYLNREDAWVLPGGRQFVEAVATIRAKSWSTKGRSPGSEALGFQKKEEKNGKQGRGKVYHGQGLKGEDPLNSWFLIRLKWTARMAAVLFPGLITFHCTCLMSQLFLSLNNSTSPWLLHPPQTLSLLFAHLFQLGWGETEREKRERLPFMAYVWKLAAAESVELWLWNRTPKQSGNASGGELHFKFRFTHKLIYSKFQIWGKNDLENKLFLFMPVISNLRNYAVSILLCETCNF